MPAKSHDGRITKARDLHTLLNLDPEKFKDRVKFDNETARRAILRFPDAAKKKHSFKSGGRVYRIHMLAWAISLGASFDVMELLYNAHPVAIEEKDNTASTPLHYASYFSAPFEIVKFLVDRHPEAVKEKNEWGDSPLHCACGRETPFSVIRLLMETHPKAISEINSFGSTPQTLAQITMKPPEVMKMLSTLDALLNEQPSDKEAIAMLREQSEGSSWRSRVAPVLNYRGSIVHELDLSEKLLPSILTRIGEECRVQAMYFVIRDLSSIFEGRYT